MFTQLTEELLDLGINVQGAHKRFLAQSSGNCTTTTTCGGSSSSGYEVM
jgi:hypothetical protein